MSEQIHSLALAGWEKLAKPNLGRTLIAGKTEDGQSLVLINLAGGRSIRSQNRQYEQVADGVYTKVFDAELPTGNPEATIYLAQKQHPYMRDNRGAYVVISNGYQTQNILDEMTRSNSMEMALWPFEHEGLQNDNTSRIVIAAETTSGKDVSFGRVYSDPLYPLRSARNTDERKLDDGYGYFISTYNGEGGVVASLDMPTLVSFQGSFEDIANKVWATADPNTTVMMAARRISIGSPEHYAVFLRDRADEFRIKYLASL